MGPVEAVERTAGSPLEIIALLVTAGPDILHFFCSGWNGEAEEKVRVGRYEVVGGEGEGITGRLGEDKKNKGVSSSINP